MKRRLFLRGLGGVALALPALEGLTPREVHAEGGFGRFAVFVRQGNGVQQATATEPEHFWPSFAPGPMTQAALAADTDRAVCELAEYATNLTFVRGIRFNDPANACRHSGGGNQVLTAATVSSDDCNTTLALGPSIDQRIVAELGASGEEPLTLYAGRKTGDLDEVLSYRGARELRAAERNPYSVYQSLFGLSNLPEAELAQLRTRRKSVNDLVRSEMQALRSRWALSSEDHRRLDLHFSAIRDLENGMACSLSGSDVTNLQTAANSLDDDDTIETVIKLHFDLIALAVSCGGVRAATLQIGSGPDATQYQVDGVKQPSFHTISHRADIPNALDLHHKIDRKLLGLFKYLLDKLAQTDTLDQGIAVYVNDLATGDHSYDNVPYLIAGGAGGFLKQGQYIDAGGVTNNKVLNTLGAALGCTNAAKEPLDDFGDPALQKGGLPALLA